MNNKKNIYFAVLIFIILAILGTFLMFSKKENTKNISKSGSINKTAENKQNVSVVISSDEFLEKQKDLKLPTEYENCKNKVGIYDCIIKQTKNPDDLSNINFYEKKLDEIDSFKDAFNDDIETIKAQFANIIKEKFMNSPKNIFPKIDCKTEFCKNTMILTKKLVFDSVKSRIPNINKSVCDNFQDEEIKNYCNLSFSK